MDKIEDKKDKKKSTNFKRLMIGGTGSGCGKTTISCAILKALKNRGLRVASFKSGPDYIDPLFHSKVTGVKSRNLDMFLCGENRMKQLFAENSRDMDISVVEGAMGLYDGLGMDKLDYSSNDMANKTKTPVVLVVDCKGMALSVAALIKGFLKFSENNIQAVILNGIREPIYPAYKAMIERHCKIKVLGFMPNIPKAAIKSRHLGLVTDGEVKDLKYKIDILAARAEKYIDLDSLIEIASPGSKISYQEYIPEYLGYTRLGIARDRAFCFYYEDNLDLLKKLGSDLVEFSPLSDKNLPSDIDGLIIGGGYPELYAKELSENTSILEDIRNAIDRAMPVYAEAGGFTYLGKTIEGEKMVGGLDINTSLTKSLQNFGYIGLEAKKDNLLSKKGDKINGHEFHYTKSDNDGQDFTAIKASNGVKRETIFAGENLFAGHPHIHFWANPNFAKNLVKKSINYRNSKN